MFPSEAADTLVVSTELAISPQLNASLIPAHARTTTLDPPAAQGPSGKEGSTSGAAQAGEASGGGSAQGAQAPGTSA